jgi:hypothetical protein
MAVVFRCRNQTRRAVGRAYEDQDNGDWTR